MRALYSHGSLNAARRKGPGGLPAGHSRIVRQKGTIVAKNKNQNRQRDRQQDQRADQPTEATEHARGPMAEEHGMPAVTPAGRKQHKKFGHN